MRQPHDFRYLSPRTLGATHGFDDLEQWMAAGMNIHFSITRLAGTARIGTRSSKNTGKLADQADERARGLIGGSRGVVLLEGPRRIAITWTLWSGTETSGTTRETGLRALERFGEAGPRRDILPRSVVVVGGLTLSLHGDGRLRSMCQQILSASMENGFPARREEWTELHYLGGHRPFRVHCDAHAKSKAIAVLLSASQGEVAAAGPANGLDLGPPACAGLHPAIRR